jgi:hypothetical protein
MNSATKQPFQALSRWAQLCMCLLLLIGGAMRASAQADQGSIVGLVQDPTGASVPNAAVTLTNTDDGLVLHAVTDSSGNYFFSPLKIGAYKVEVSSPGFNTTVQQNIHVHVQDRVEADVMLKIGSADTQVEVSTSPPLLQTENSSTGQIIEAKTINETPLNGRNWVFIAQLTAGVAPASGSRGSKGGDFEANGQRAEQNNYIMDGVDNNVNVVDFFNGASYVVRPPPDALAEFKVQTGSYSSEFGHSAGAVVNASIRSGTNQIHGSFWEYIRNDAFDVREFFQGNLPIAKYRQNQFGATLGIPILKNKLFFFGDLEANRIIFGATHSGLQVPTALMRTGDFSELLTPALVNGKNQIQLYVPNATAGGTTPVPGNRLDQVPGLTLDPVALRILSLFPAPNTGVPGLTYNNFTQQTADTDNTFQWDTRVDANITNKDQIFGRFSYNHEPSNFPPPFGNLLDGGGFGATGQVVALGENFAGSYSHEFNPSLLNEFRFGYNYGHFDGLQANANNPTAASNLGLGGIPYAANQGGLPSFNVGGLSGFGSPTFYATNEYENVYQILDNLTKVLGNHTIKVGVDIQRIRFSTSQPTQPRGSYNFNGLFTSQPGTPNTGYGVADFLTNNMNSSAISNVFTSDDVRFNRAGYAQDDWKVSPRLTVNYGLRYDYSTPYLERHDNQAAFIPTSAPTAGNSTGVYRLPSSKRNVFLPVAFTSLLAADNITLEYTDNRYLVKPQKSNLAPRVGFSLKATDKLVAHGGFGIFFGGLESTGYYPNLGENFPFEFDSTFSSSGCSYQGACANNGFTLERGFTDALATGLLNSISQPSLRGSEPNVRTPYSEQYNLTFNYGVTNSTVASIGYVGAVSRHLIVFPNPNGQVAVTPSNFSGYTDPQGRHVNPFQPFPHFGGVSFTAYDGSSNYNSLQTTLEQRATRDLSFLVAYTYAHSLDNAPTPLGSTADGGYRATNVIGINADYSNSPFDVRHRFTVNANYQLPVGYGKHFLNNRSIVSEVIGGFSSSFVFRAQTGEPITIGPNTFVGVSGGNAYANKVGNPFATGGTPPPGNPAASCPTKVHTIQHWYNPCAFANPKQDDLGYTGGKYSDGKAIPNAVFGQAALPYLGAPRNQTYGPGYVRVDMSLFKDFHIFREAGLRFRADAFNLLNTPAYGDPSTANDSADGGKISGPRFFQANTPDSRFFQFALNLHY